MSAPTGDGTPPGHGGADRAAAGDGGAAIAATVAAGLRDVPDFPKPGILFKDITPLLADGVAFRAAVAGLAAFARASGPLDLVSGIEARGFVLAAALAHELGCGLVPVRKAGKLPPPTLRRAYELEYGWAEIEVPDGVLEGRRVFLVDDVLATGGTLAAALDLISDAGGQVSGVGVVLELVSLAGRERLADVEIRTLLRT
jgi:adenine phosphoribosyltransferase